MFSSSSSTPGLLMTRVGDEYQESLSGDRSKISGGLEPRGDTLFTLHALSACGFVCDLCYTLKLFFLLA